MGRRLLLDSISPVGRCLGDEACRSRGSVHVWASGNWDRVRARVRARIRAMVRVRLRFRLSTRGGAGG